MPPNIPESKAATRPLATCSKCQKTFRIFSESFSQEIHWAAGLSCLHCQKIYGYKSRLNLHIKCFRLTLSQAAASCYFCSKEIGKELRNGDLGSYPHTKVPFQQGPPQVANYLCRFGTDLAKFCTVIYRIGTD